MFFAGGAVTLLLDLVCNGVFSAAPLFFKCVVGALLITAVEFSVGCVVNLRLGMNVWDYSSFHCQVLGQICLFYSVLWGVLTLPAVLLLEGLRSLIVF